MSRHIHDLKPEVVLLVHELVQSCRVCGVDLLIYCTYRSPQEQARLYRIGRPLSEIQHKADELETTYQRPDLAKMLLDAGPQSGKKPRTWAAPGQSYHQYRLALDAVPLREGKPVWETEEYADKALWTTYGSIAESLGFKWAGRWRQGKREYPHIHYTDKSWKALIRQ